MNKKGLGPIISAVILIVIAVVIAGIVFTWGNNFILGLSPPGLLCGDVNFEAGVFGNELDVINRGDIELHGFVIKSVKVGEARIIEEITLENVIPRGESAIILLKEKIEPENLLIIPIVLEDNVGGKELYTCGDGFGVKSG